MSRGLLVNMALMIGVIAFAMLTVASQMAALVTASGLVLCAGSMRRLERLPTLMLYVIVALVPLSYLHKQVAFGALNSLSKLVFIPAFGVLLLDWIVSRRPLVVGRQGGFIALYGLALAISFFINAATPHSLWFLSRFASMMLLFFLCANVIRGERDLAVLMGVVVAASVVSAMGSDIWSGGGVTSGGGFTRENGWSLDDAPTFGTNILVALLLAVYALFVTRKPWLRFVLIPMIGMLLLAIVLTFARGVSIVTALSLAFLLFKLRRRITPGWTVAVIAVAGVCLILFVPSVFWHRLATSVTQFGTDPTIGRRIDSLRIGFELFSRYPLLGLGPGNFLMQYMSPEFRFDHSATPSVCFNLYLSIATQAGLLGLAAFGLIVWGSFYELHFVAKSYGGTDGVLKQAAEVLEIILVAFLLVSLFEPTDLHKYMWIAFGTVAAVGRIRRTELSGRAEICAENG